MAINFRALFSKTTGFICLFLLFSQLSFSQVTIWLEDFSVPMPPAPGWTDNFNDCDGGGTAGRSNNRYEVNDMEGFPCCPTGATTGGANGNEWITNPINIDNYCNVSISVDYGSIGTFECAAGGPIFNCTGDPFTDNGHDQIVAEYRIDGGPWIQFGYLCGGGSGTFTATGLTGNTIEIRIMPANKSQAEIYWFDNVEVTGTPGPMLTPIAPLEFCAGATVNIPLTSTPPGATFSWTNDNTAIGLGASGTGSPINFPAAAVTATEMATITITPTLNGCTGPTTTFLVTVNPSPNVNQPNNIIACANTQVNGIFSGTTGALFEWTNDNTAIGLMASGTGNFSFNSAAVTTQEVANITVTPTNAAGCMGTPRTFTITINPTSAVDDPGDLIICSGQNIDVEFTGTASGFNWANNNTGTGIPSIGSSNISTPSPVFYSGTQVSSITVTPTGICPAPPVNFTVTVQPTTLIDPIANIVACSGQMVNIPLTGQPINSPISWTNDNTAIGLLSAGSGSIMFLAANVSTPQVALITLQSGSGICPGPDEAFTITINPGTAMNAVPNITVCGGGNIDIQFSGAGAGATYSWTNNNTGVGIPAAGTGNILQTASSPLTNQTATITVIPSSGGCAGPMVSFTVNVIAIPSLSAPSDTVVCPNQPLAVNFSGASGTTFNWVNSNTNIGLGASGTGNISFTSAAVTLPSTGTITVTPSIGVCSGTPVDFDISVNPEPTISLVSVDCAANLLSYAVTISVTNATTVTSTAGVISGGAGAFIIDMIPAGANIIITASSGGNCTDQLTVNAPNCNCSSVPAPTNPNNPVICEGALTPALMVTAIAGLETDWYAAASGGVSLATNNTSFTPTGPFAAGAYTFFAETRDPATGCISAVRTPVTLTVNLTPTANPVADTAVCAGAMLNIVFTGTAGANFSWTNTNTNIGLGALGTGDILYTPADTISPSGTGLITVTPTIGTCPGTPVNFSITVNALPTLTLGTVQCASDLLTYSVALTSDAVNLIATAGAVTGSGTAYLINQIPADTNIIITATSAANCISQINITAPNCNCPSVPLPGNPSNLTICEGASVPALTVTIAAGFEVDWYSDPASGTLLAPNTTTYTPAGPFSAGIYTFYAEARDAATGCLSSGRIPVVLTVNATPSMSAPSNVAVCPSEPVTINFSGTTGATFDWTNSNTNIGLGASNTGDIVFNAATGLTVIEAGNITVVPNLGTCMGAPVNFTITVNPLPTLMATTTNCAPDLLTYTVTLSSNAAMLNATAGTVSGSAGTFTVTSIPVGTNIVVTASSADNCTTQQTITSPICTCPPVALATTPNNPAICEGNPIPALSVSAIGGLEVDWFTTPAGGSPVSTNSLSYTPPGPLAAGLYTFYAETREPATGCTSASRTAVTLTINATPTMAPTSNVTVCSGQPVMVNFTGTPGAVFNWTNSNTAIGLSSTSGMGNISFNSASGLILNTSSTLSVYPQIGTCQGLIQNFSITVNALPVLAPGTPVCAPDLQTYSITVSTNSSTVTATAGTVSGSGFNWTISQIPAGSNVIVTSTSSTNCNATVNITAPNCSCPTIAPPSNPNNPTACQGDAFAPLSAQVNTGLQVNWYSAATGGILLAANSPTYTPPIALPVGVYTIYAAAVDPLNNCESIRIPVSVTITDGLNASFTGNTAVCAGNSTTLTASGGNTFQWSTGATSASANITPLTSNAYTVVVSNNNTCADTLIIPITVNLPYNITVNTVTCDPAQAGTTTVILASINGCDSTITTNTTIDLISCAPEVVVVSDSVDCAGNADGGISLLVNDGFPPYTYTWSGVGLSGSGQISTTGAVDIVEDLPVGNYSFTVTGANGATVVVTGSVNAPEDIQVATTDGLVSCFGGNDGVIQASASGGVPPYIYLWNDGQTTSNAIGLSDIGAYTVTVTDAKGCTSSNSAMLSSADTFMVTLSALPPQCGDQTIAYTIGTIGGESPFVVEVDSIETNSIRVNLAQGEHIITVTDNNGCQASATTFVVVPQTPVISLPQDTSIALGQVLDIVAQTNLSVWDTLIWKPLFDSLSANTLVQSQLNLINSTAVQISITDTSGCIATASMLISVRKDKDIYAPNIFAPNETGRNDYWKIFAGPSVEALEEAYIFDRWGDAIYAWTDIVPLDSWPGWDGNSRGKKSNPGVYVYYVWLKLVNGERLLIKGDVTLLR